MRFGRAGSRRLYDAGSVVGRACHDRIGAFDFALPPLQFLLGCESPWSGGRLLGHPVTQWRGAGAA